MNTHATFTFDSLNRTVEEGQTYGTDHCYVTHDKFTGYSATDLCYPNGRQVASGYDALYRRNGVTEVSGGTSIAAWSFYGSRVATVVLGNGQTVSMMNNAQTHSAVQPSVANPPWNSSSPSPMDDRLGYDGSGRMITKRYVQSAGSTSAALVVGYTTAYDASGNKYYERALHAPDRSALYDQYDSMDRLADYKRGTLAVGGGSVTPSTMSLINSQQSYNLDALGNWNSTSYTPVGSSTVTQMRVHNLLNEGRSKGTLTFFAFIRETRAVGKAGAVAIGKDAKGAVHGGAKPRLLAVGVLGKDAP